MKKIQELLKDTTLEQRDILNLLILIMISSGIFGFLYEELFYRIDLGYFVKRGSTFGPWIPIYAFGGLFITLITYKQRKKPLLVFLFSLLITGILEYATGAFFWNILHTRLWDYNTEIWNFGNINGYICLRSVMLFGLSGLFLIYILIPILIKILKKGTPRRKNILCTSVIILFLMDILLYWIIKA